MVLGSDQVNGSALKGLGRVGVSSTAICFTICLIMSPDLDGHRAPKMKYHVMFHDIDEAVVSRYVCSLVRFHDMFVHQSGLRRAQGTKNEILSHRDPQKVSKPKYEAAAFCSHRSIGYPNPTNGQYTPHNGTPFRT